MRISVSASGSLPDPFTVSPNPAKAVSPSLTAAITNPGAPAPRNPNTPAKPAASSSSRSSAGDGCGATTASVSPTSAASARAPRRDVEIIVLPFSRAPTAGGRSGTILLNILRATSSIPARVKSTSAGASTSIAEASTSSLAASLSALRGELVLLERSDMRA
jgi:hypothetical protein